MFKSEAGNLLNIKCYFSKKLYGQQYLLIKL